MTNEFHEKSLRAAIKSATGGYRKSCGCLERKRGASCNDLVLEITGLQREAGRLSDEASRLEDEAEDLRRQALIDLGIAALSALGGLAVAARGAAIGARVFSSRSARGLTRQDVYDLLSLFGPVGTAVFAVKAALDVAKAERLIDLAEDLVSNGERLGEELLDVVDEYERSGCGSGDHLRS